MKETILFKPSEISEDKLKSNGEFYVDGTCICREFSTRINVEVNSTFPILSHSYTDFPPFRVDFLVKQHEPERLGPEPTDMILSALNNMVNGIYGFHGQVQEGLINAIDRLLYNHGYAGKIVDDEYCYPNGTLYVYTYAKELI